MPKKQKETFVLKYVGNTPETAVNGLGVFKKEKEVTFEDLDQIKAAKDLVKTNVNFKEVEK